MKKNFLLENKQKDTVDTLTDEEAGKLFKGIFNYVNTGDSGLKGVLKAVFIPFKQIIDDNEQKYKERCETNKKNGSKGGAPKGNKNASKNRKQPKTTENNRKQHDARHISYINNHISNINLEDKGVIGGEETFTEVITKPYKTIIDKLNELAGTNYKPTSKQTQAKIDARLNEGYTLDDFIVVIEKKVFEWKDTDLAKYLRPETLFGTKFESYLNQPVNKKINTANPFLASYMEEMEVDYGK